MDYFTDKPVYNVQTLHGSVDLSLSVPGSKSITNRALLLAALAKGKSVLMGALFSEDSRHFLSCLQELGFPVEIDEKNHTVTVTGFGGQIPKKEASIYVGSAGTAARFLTAMLGLSDGIYHLDSSEQMKKRPMKPLLDSLESIGVEVIYEDKEGFFPFTLKGSSHTRNTIEVNIQSSSQFLSALLMSAPMKAEGLTISLVGEKHALSYVAITTTMMKQFGCTVKVPAEGQYIVPAASSYQPQSYQIEPDVSAACYFYSMVPLLGGTVQVQHVHRTSMQGDIRFLSILEGFGCTLTDAPDGIRLSCSSPRSYAGMEIDLSDCSDQTMTLAALAPFASSPVTIRNIAHIRLQESNRIRAIVTELTRLGISCMELEDGIYIEPGRPRAGVIETYADHRIAMSFSLIGLVVPGIQISNPACCKKTFEEYFEILDHITKKGRI